MLSIGRNPGEYIMIGDNIKVMVVESGNLIRLAIEAPREISIVRGEHYEKQKKDNISIETSEI